MTKTILIIEDNPLVREMYRSALKSLNARLVETQRGEVAVAVAKHEHPDLILLDIMLPDMSGHEVAVRLKASPETAHIPILAVTNTATASDEDALKCKGFAGLITKPINVPRFLETVTKFLPK